MAARLGTCTPAAVERQSSATVLVKTEAIPNATPAAAASSTLRTAGRFTTCAATKTTATAPKVTSASISRCPPSRECESLPSVRASSPARPTVAMSAPRQAVWPALRPTNSAAIGSANTMVSAPSGWTRLSGP
ncbi:hypothetical protein HY68_27205 [Streptomyces sp. AcH 505]|nr:hypothetical protein HY68_27205 [Streptomyces sp. AcH 505]